MRDGDNQNMRRGLRVDVPKSNGVFVAVNNLRGNVPRYDAAKKTTHS
jgi:hypothetical protein